MRCPSSGAPRHLLPAFKSGLPDLNVIESEVGYLTSGGEKGNHTVPSVLSISRRTSPVTSGMTPKKWRKAGRA